jgi:peptide/nickel transport system permease protein
MWAYLLRRTLWALAVFVAVTLGTYVTFFVIAERSPQAVQGLGGRRQQIQRAAHLRRLDKPVLVQYASYLKGIAHGSLGQADSTRRSVNDVVLRAVPVTASLLLGGILIWITVALVVGVHSALRPRSLLDRFAMVGVLIGISAHPVWIGLVLGYLLGYKAHVFPITGYCDFFDPAPGRCGGPVEWIWHLLLPCFTLAVFFAAIYVRMVRANVIEALDEDWVRTARAKGAGEWHVIRHHVLRNALLPVVTMLGMDIGLALGSAAFVEVVFGLPGVGRVAIENLSLVRAVETGNYAPLDLPIIAGVVVVMTAAIILANLAADLLYSWFDPRIDPTGGEPIRI